MTSPIITSGEPPPETNREPSVLFDILRWRAENQPDKTAYTFLPDGDASERSVTYSQLDREARRVGGLLQGAGASSERVLLLYAPGLDYLAGFFGCLYAGAVAVPAYPPRVNQSLRRLQSIARDSQARFALTTSTGLSRIRSQNYDFGGMEAVSWIDTDVEVGSGDDWRYPSVTADSLALIQYTSGSTGDPKGVMLSHENLLRNSAMLSDAFEYGSESRCVSWLPVYHDMGLIGGILQPMFGGFPCVLMSPAAFLRRPILWLETITRYRATISGAPNFAYDLCVRKINDQLSAGLDLSSWSVAFTGSEPIRKESLDRFAAHFESCGFRREAFFPCYGLAEATLIVSGGPKAVAPLAKTVRRSAVENARVIETSPADQDSAPVVSCGRVLPRQKVLIVQPEFRTLCADDEIGEIWLSGGSVAQGYWGRPEQTQDVFQARLAESGEGPFLRTGDLGFVREGELFLTGRLKDLIIIRGLNHYPQDIETTVQGGHPALHPDCGAAFSIDVSGEERLVVVQEVDRRLRSDPGPILDAIRQRISETHELQAYGVVLIKAGSLPKTTSGKVQRGLCRAMYLAGALTTVAEWRAQPLRTGPVDLAVTDIAETAEVIQAFLASQVALRAGLHRDEVDVNQPAVRYGLDSLSVVEIAHACESSLGARLPATRLLENVTIADLAQETIAEMQAPYPLKDVVHGREASGEQALSFGQQAMWFLHQLAPTSPAYNIATAIRINTPLDVDAMRRTFQALINRHSALRTTFGTRRGQPVQRVDPTTSFALSIRDASTWSAELLGERLSAYSREPFDLEQGPLIRVGLFTQPAHEHVLCMVVHHIIADFWSLAILMREIGILYKAEVEQASSGRAAEASGAAASATLPPLEVEYTDYVRWQAEMLAGERGERLFSYWREQLRGAPLVLDLPTDRPRPNVQTYQGASHSFRLDPELADELKRFSQARNVTLYVTLVAAFQSLLYRYTSQDDLLLGTLMAGRNLEEVRAVVGYFVNPVALRAVFSEATDFDCFLAQTHKSVLGALEHQDYPFALLVERLQPQRDPSRSPLFQVMFMLQKAHLLHEAGLTAFALGESGARMETGGLSLESVALEQRVAQFDLTLVIAETCGTLGVSLQYDKELFDDSTIVRLAGRLQVLFQSIVANPRVHVLDLPILAAAEADQLLLDMNGEHVPYDQELCIHHLFEAQAERSPDAIAVVFNDEELTYEELNRRANRIAHRLMSMGVEPETPVGICVERSTEMMAGLLGILKAGGAYVPLDPSYPRDRLRYVIDHASVFVVVTQERLRDLLPTEGRRLVYLDESEDEGGDEYDLNPDSRAAGMNPAYVIYTSGSTGKPKGVTVCHRSVINFFHGMDRRIGCSHKDTLFAVTSISFDISVLELFWTLANGAKVVVLSQEAMGRGAGSRVRTSGKGIDFSLFYFANEDSQACDDRYRLVIEGAKFADRRGFSAVWTPERHFHAFGGLYPNPSVMGAALAVLTERIQIRAGSVVLPLHNVIRVAEEWSLVDNLSKGRVGIAVASGWHSDDFAFFPENYADRKRVMLTGIEALKTLWCGEPIVVRGGSGKDVEVRVFPKPIQRRLPIWITAAGSPDTFIKAGELGANILTHLLGQTVEEVEKKVTLYRDAREQHGHDGSGHVTLMLHTFIAENRESAREKVRKPFTNYLRTSVDLIANLAKSMDLPLKLEELSGTEMEDLLEFAFNRYFETSALFGSPADCKPMIERLKNIGVDEVACLIDFGVDADSVLAALPNLERLKEDSNKREGGLSCSLQAQAEKHKPSLMQCTPSMMSMLMLDKEAMDSLRTLRVLMLGGEAVPPALVRTLRGRLACRCVNLYGPTETTVWSATHDMEDAYTRLSIGRPIVNTGIHIVDQRLRPRPVGTPGELCIGGDGLARGYFNEPDLTADKFVPNPFGSSAGARLYKTGDRARYLADGTIEFLGRLDYQVKIRGFRIETGEIERMLREHPNVKEAVVVAREDEPGDQRLVAYVAPNQSVPPSQKELKEFLRNHLPEYMTPAAVVILSSLPLTPNGKIDRKALPRPEGVVSSANGSPVMPRNKMEQAIADVWKEVLRMDRVGVNDNFFDLGGHSLLMAQAHSRLQEIFSKKLPLIKILQHPTISSLARYIGQQEDEISFFEENKSRALKQREGLRRQRLAAARRNSTSE